MATTAFVVSGLEFVPNNYTAPLNTVNALEAFHLVQRFLANSDIGHALTEPTKLSGSQIRTFWQTEPQTLNPSSLNTEPPLSTSQQPQSGGRIKKRAFKRKVRANRPQSNDEDDVDHEILHQRKRRMVANYLFDELEVEAPKAANQEVVNEAPLAVSKEAVIDEATVSDEARVHADAEADIPAQDDFFNDFEAHPSISVCNTEDVVSDQPTLVIDESLATHTEILSVNNQVPEKGEEVDQVVEADVELINEAIAEDMVETADETVPEETEVFANVNSENVEAVAEQVLEEAAQLNTEATAENVFNEAAEPIQDNVDANDDQNSEHSLHAISNINVELSNSDESTPFLRDPDDESIKEKQTATEAHFREMYYANWSGADCIFSKQRTADFVDKSAKEISNPELLSHLKATIVQVKSLNNRFDETHKVVMGLSNDIVAKELALKTDRTRLSSMIKDQVEIKQRLSKVEENQTAMSSQLTSIATSLELLTSVFIPDDVKKGEKVPKDKCKRTPTLRLRDDSNDGGSRGAEKRSKIIQEQGRLRSNSARNLTNSDRVNSGAPGASGGQFSSRLKSLVISSNPTTDEEIAAKLFIEEHGGEATVEDMDAEMKLLAEEHQKKVEAGTYKKKAAKAPKRKEKGIIIKENVNSQQSLQYSRRPAGANTDKGKGKLIEKPEFSKKYHSTSDTAQVESVLNQSTSDKAQVDNSVKVVTTSDIAQVVQTQLISPQLQDTFRKSSKDETLKSGNVNILQSRTVMGKESYDRSGLGSHREKRINNSPADHTSLAESGIGVTQENLDKLESVQMIYHRGLKKEFLLYFMNDGRVYRIGEADIHLKLLEELEYVLYLLTIKNISTHDAALVLRDRMMKSKVILRGGVLSAYIPKYRDAYGKIVEMKRNSARFKTALGIKTGESDPELKELKEIMVDELEKAERRLLIDYLRTVPDIEEIK
ncbi:hypothetical protein POM88_036095 [Heracleum sosnowskyi]|uniref:Uncharacterized protein n=1 Tax=Heracleum sosnowskyi TaxID=360622 RepID=A0AAD8HPF0_9APIA|nr:hypothetical protein POM88_036095 [Heracleum sosnowskyi]